MLLVSHCQALIKRIRHPREMGVLQEKGAIKKQVRIPCCCAQRGRDLLGLMDTRDVIPTVIACCLRPLGESEIFVSFAIVCRMAIEDTDPHPGLHGAT